MRAHECLIIILRYVKIIINNFFINVLKKALQKEMTNFVKNTNLLKYLYKAKTAPLFSLTWLLY